MTTPNESPIRILQILGGMNPGGIETWLMRVLRTIDRSRFRLDFLVHRKEPGVYDDEIRSLGSKVIPCLRPSRPLSYVRNLRKIWHEHGPYDVVHSHTYFFSGFVLFLSRKLGSPLRVAHIYPDVDHKEGRFLRGSYQKFMSRLIARNATDILACSRTTLKAFLSICNFPQERARVIYHGIDLEPFRRKVDRDAVRRKLGLPADKPLIVYVARLVPYKNHLQAVRVADLMKKEGHDAHFALVGSRGPMLRQLEEMSGERDNLSLLTGLTGVEDVSDILLASDLFFFPSVNEGFGIVVLEAAAAGLPVVATDLPTIREALPPAHRDFMFPLNDDRAAARNILKILGDEKIKEKLAADARSWAESFSIRKSTDQLVSLYQKARPRDNGQ